MKKFDQTGIVHIGLIIAIIIIGAVGFYLYRQKEQVNAVINKPTFSNLSAILRQNFATFNFVYSENTPSYTIKISTDSGMTKDPHPQLANGTSIGIGSSSPITILNPRSLWHKYQCNSVVYWQLETSYKKMPIRSAVQKGTVNCSMPIATATPQPTPLPSEVPAKRVFVTSVFYNGNLGGLAGADAKCQERAGAANLGGTWKAWLSSNTVSAASRLSRSNNPYKLLDGTIIANNWAQLISTDKTILAPIRISELRTIVNGYVWTNTNDIGGIRNIIPENTCFGWTSASGSYGGFVGDSRLTYQTVTWIDPTNTVRTNLFNQWTDAQGQGVGYNDYSYCNKSLSLYCFEQ